jgi:hypothetical protein
LLFLALAPFVFAEDNMSAQPALSEAYVKFRQIGWQTYEFSVITNLKNNDLLSYEWSVDSMETFNSPKLHYFFTSGQHTIRLKVEDVFGNVRYDKVKLDVKFWSLSNNWFWWILYLLLVFILLYYWIAKIIYLLHRNRMSKQVRYFFDALDEHGWAEKTINELISKNKRLNKAGPGGMI